MRRVRAAGDGEVVVFTREELRKILDHDKALNLAVLREAEQRLGLLERRWRAATMDGALVIPMGSSHGVAAAAGSSSRARFCADILWSIANGRV